MSAVSDRAVGRAVREGRIIAGANAVLVPPDHPARPSIARRKAWLRRGSRPLFVVDRYRRNGDAVLEVSTLTETSAPNVWTIQITDPTHRFADLAQGDLDEITGSWLDLAVTELLLAAKIDPRA